MEASKLLLQQQQKARLPTISPEQLTKIPEDLVCAFQLLCKAAKEDRAQLKRLEAESARLVKRAERGEADKQLLQAQLKELQAALAEKEAQLVKQAEARARGNSTIVDQLLLKVNEQRQELSTLQDALQQKQGQLLQQQQELQQLQMQLWEQDSAEMDVRGQLRAALQRAEAAEATAASARSKHAELSAQLASIMSLVDTPLTPREGDGSYKPPASPSETAGANKKDLQLPKAAPTTNRRPSSARALAAPTAGGASLKAAARRVTEAPLPPQLQRRWTADSTTAAPRPFVGRRTASGRSSPGLPPRPSHHSCNPKPLQRCSESAMSDMRRVGQQRTPAWCHLATVASEEVSPALVTTREALSAEDMPPAAAPAPAAAAAELAAAVVAPAETGARSVAAKAMAKIDAVLTSIQARASSGGGMGASLFGGLGSKATKQQQQQQQQRGTSCSNSPDTSKDVPELILPTDCCLLSPGVTLESELPPVVCEAPIKAAKGLQGAAACADTNAGTRCFMPGPPTYTNELHALLGCLQQSCQQLQALQQQQQQQQQQKTKQDTDSYLVTHTSKQPNSPRRGIPRHAEERAMRRAAMFQSMVSSSSSSSKSSSSAWQQRLREYTTGGGSSGNTNSSSSKNRRHSSSAARAAMVPGLSPRFGRLSSSNSSSLWTTPAAAAAAAGPEFEAPSGNTSGRGLSLKQIQYVMTRTGYGGLYYSLS